ncbi:MAG: rRNA maturation RNase YbeY, partial [Oscillospiraceae bacterium]
MEKIKVLINNNQSIVKIPVGIRLLIRRCCNAVLNFEGFKDKAEISVSFVDNEQIRELNKSYRNVDNSTDVLSFPLGENGVYDLNNETGAYLLGDIVISLETALKQSHIYGHSLEREIGFLTV